MLVIQWCPALCNSMDCSPSRLLCPWNSPGKNTGVGSHSLLQGIFPTQGSNLGLLHCRHIFFFFFLPSESPRKPRCIFIEVSVQFSRSVVSDSATPWIIASQASVSITNSQSLHKLMSIESVMPSNHLILCRPLLLPPSIFPSIRIFSNESVLLIRWPKCWEFQLQHQSFQWIFKIDFL